MSEEQLTQEEAQAIVEKLVARWIYEGHDAHPATINAYTDLKTMHTAVPYWDFDVTTSIPVGPFEAHLRGCIVQVDVEGKVRVTGKNARINELFSPYSWGHMTPNEYSIEEIIQYVLDQCIPEDHPARPLVVEAYHYYPPEDGHIGYWDFSIGAAMEPTERLNTRGGTCQVLDDGQIKFYTNDDEFLALLAPYGEKPRFID